MLLRASLLLLIWVSYCLASNDIEQLKSWDEWKLEHDKHYLHEEEHLRRKQIWLANADRVRQHNARYKQGLETYYKGLNAFADLTWEEFQEAYLSSSTLTAEDNVQSVPFQPNNEPLPMELDWRENDCVTPVKNQSTCAASWAFAAIGALECQIAQKDKLTSLSAQQLIDCSKEFGTKGCQGVNVYDAYRYLNVDPIQSENSYPYKGVDKGKCQADATKGLAKVKSFYSVRQGDEDLLMRLIVYFGPAAVSINVNEDIQLYAGGVYRRFDCPRENPNLSLLIVGYAGTHFKRHWIMKTSFGPKYGREGYFLLALDGTNMCGVANHAAVPMMKKIV